MFRTSSCSSTFSNNHMVWLKIIHPPANHWMSHSIQPILDVHGYLDTWIISKAKGGNNEIFDTMNQCDSSVFCFRPRGFSHDCPAVVDKTFFEPSGIKGYRLQNLGLFHPQERNQPLGNPRLMAIGYWFWTHDTTVKITGGTTPGLDHGNLNFFTGLEGNATSIRRSHFWGSSFCVEIGGWEDHWI